MMQKTETKSAQYVNGYRARVDGYARHANPVQYCIDGKFSVSQSRLRDEWFDGWDAAESELVQ